MYAPRRTFPAIAPFRHGFQFDLGRQMERPERIAAHFRRLGEAGYRLALLNLEDALDFPSAPGIGRAHCWSMQDLALVADAAHDASLELVPIIPSLGHALYITGKPGYASYDELPESPVGSLRIDEEATYDLLGRLFDDWCAAVPDAHLHTGLDESPWLGAARRRVGLPVNAPRLFAEHCNRLAEMLRARSRRMVIWGDMLYYFPEAIGLLPKDIIVMDWYYYSFTDTPKVELFNFAPVDLTSALRSAGLEVWHTPSVWPNAPIGDIRDRLANLRDYARYALQRQPTATLVNTDWNNWCGWSDFAELLWLTFIRLEPHFHDEDLADALADSLRRDYGLPHPRRWADILLEMGSLHLTGSHARQTAQRSLAGWLIRDFERRAEIHAHAIKAARLLQNAAALAQASPNILAAEIQAALRLLFHFWNIQDTLARLADATGPDAADTFDQLARDLAKYQRDYDRLFGRIRFPNDYRHPLQTFAGRLSDEVAALAQRLRDDAKTTPSTLLPRIELSIRCPHPAMPVLELDLQYDDGTRETSREMTLKFESAYSRPDAAYRHVAAIPIAPGRHLAALLVTNRDYDLTEIQSITLYQDGAAAPMTLPDGRTSAVIGVLAAAPGAPTIRDGTDRLRFTPPCR